MVFSSHLFTLIYLRLIIKTCRFCLEMMLTESVWLLALIIIHICSNKAQCVLSFFLKMLIRNYNVKVMVVSAIMRF